MLFIFNSCLHQHAPSLPSTSHSSPTFCLCPTEQLENGPHAPVYQLLNLFAYGTYCDYKGIFSTTAPKISKKPLLLLLVVLLFLFVWGCLRLSRTLNEPLKLAHLRRCRVESDLPLIVLAAQMRNGLIFNLLSAQCIRRSGALIVSHIYAEHQPVT